MSPNRRRERTTTRDSVKRRRRLGRTLTPYALSLPGAGWLVAFFLVPLGMIVYVSLQSGGLLLGGFHFTWEFSNYAEALADGREFLIRSIVYATAVTAIALLIAYPMTYWIAFYAGRWKASFLFLILAPFFVSFVIRTVQWGFLLADNGVILGPLKSLGLLPDDFVMRAPAATASSISPALLAVPLTEINSGGTPARRAAVSSDAPNVSHPSPSWVSTRRSARAVFAFREGRIRVGPSGKLVAKARVNSRALRRSWSSDTT